MNYYIEILTNVGISLIGVLSVFVISGMTGLFSLGQASFMAIGAYTAGILAKSTGWGLVPCLIMIDGIGAIWSPVVVFLVLIVFLILRPQGIAGRITHEKV